MRGSDYVFTHFQAPPMGLDDSAPRWLRERCHVDNLQTVANSKGPSGVDDGLTAAVRKLTAPSA